MTDDLRALGAQFTFPASHRRGEALLQVVYADPGTNGFYYRERVPDSVAAYVRADIHADALDKIERLTAAMHRINDKALMNAGEFARYVRDEIAALQGDPK